MAEIRHLGSDAKMQKCDFFKN